MKFEAGKRRISGPIEFYIFVRKVPGHDERIQIYEHDGKFGMLVARGEKAARKFLKQARNRNGSVSMSRVRTREGESIESLARGCAKFGATGAWVVESGKMYWHPFEMVTDL